MAFPRLIVVAVPALIDATQRSFLAVCGLQQPFAQAMDMAATVGCTHPALGRLGIMQATCATGARSYFITVLVEADRVALAVE